ncbi:MAG: DUF2520 domain-containing protein [Planctomycetes bacterium]|nr:DUF2520 domain-containing protein [Planctomycetota bacterium]
MGLVAIIGAGHTGRALGRALARAGWEIGGVSCRTPARAREAVAFIGSGRPFDDPVRAAAEADVVLVTVPDGAVAQVGASLRPTSGAVIAHTCGALSAEVLAPVRARGAHAGALHPLRSFADPALAAERFPGTWCAVDGDPAAVTCLESMVRAVGGIPMRVDSARKPLYHAGAVFASNYLVAILEAALRLFEAAGVDRAVAKEPLRNLARGALENVERVGIPAALTGPIDRGDVDTVRAHVAALREAAPGLHEAYAALARLTCEVALAKGTIDAPVAERINAEMRSP